MYTKRTDALQHGAPRFNTGRPCKAGHISDRYTSSGACIACMNQTQSSIAEAARVAILKGHDAQNKRMGKQEFRVFHGDTQIAERFFEVLQYGTSAMRQQLSKLIDEMHQACEMPNTLNRDDLVRIMQWDENFDNGKGKSRNIGTFLTHEDEFGTGNLPPNQHEYLLISGWCYTFESIKAVLERRCRIAVPYKAGPK